MQGQTIPFNALFVVRVWDKSKDGLNAKAGAIRNAVNSMNSAQYFESNLPSTSKNLFFQTWPGWTWGRYEYRKLYAEHRYLADMLPVTTQVSELPDDVKAAVPMMRDISIIRTGDKILLVRAPSMVVTGEIGVQ